ncbi:iron complex transport system substrate-binding protein [Tindallia magadiensis]|uniref:Iron complex transport system substrate-binding protein n=1 Tax=Tindallia magadiensis TaxID=69895 RepID=A0A1I3GE33_9FIRM|nr:ABC transporter substrate-binding protein [Tindallia magadiensis]SFI21756.1 iron complex transport system substrate-binding protein [Tindallia magadiensis]
MKKKWLSLLLMVGILFFIGCGKEEVQTDSKEIITDYQPVTIQNFNRTLSITEVPERIVSMNVHTTEILFTLGLGDRIVGTAFNNAEILPEFKEDFDRIPVLAERYPSMEVLLGAEPDFVYGRDSAFGANGTASVSEMETYGIHAYAVKGTLVNGATMDDVYEDFLNLGRIFDVEEKAIAIVSEMQQEMEGIQQQLGEIEKPVKVLVFDMGGDTVFTAGQSLQTTLIEMAGGKNIFDDIANNWGSVSWEEVVDRNPEVIVINDYGDETAEEKIDELLTNPFMQEVDAVKNQRFVVLPLPSVFEGPRNVDALRILAEGFYPEQF